MPNFSRGSAKARPLTECQRQEVKKAEKNKPNLKTATIEVVRAEIRVIGKRAKLLAKQRLEEASASQTPKKVKADQTTTKQVAVSVQRPRATPQDFMKLVRMGRLDIDEAGLIQSAQNGDVRATEQLLKNYHDLIRRKSYKYQIPHHAPEDLQGEFHWEIIKPKSGIIASYDPRMNKSFKNFLGACLDKKITSLLKTGTRQMRKNPHGADHSLSYTEEGDRPLEDTMAVGFHDQRIDAIEVGSGFSFEQEMLKYYPRAKMQRRVAIARSFLARYLGDFSYADVAIVLGLDPEKSRKSIDNALSRIRTKFPG